MNTTDRLARARAFLDAWPVKPIPGLDDADLIAEGVMAGDPDLYASDLRAVLDELKQIRDEVERLRGERDRWLGQAFASGWCDALAALRTPGWAEREAAWAKYLADVRAGDALRQPEHERLTTDGYGEDGSCWCGSVECAEEQQQPEHDGSIEQAVPYGDSKAAWDARQVRSFRPCADCYSPMTCAEADEPRCP